MSAGRDGKLVLADGRAVQLFAAVPEGATVHALRMRSSDLASETAGVVRRAMAQQRRSDACRRASADDHERDSHRTCAPVRGS